MSYVMSPIEADLPDLSGYAAYANLQVGSNGDPNGVPTTLLGDLYGDENWAFNTWDNTVTGGFDTSLTNVSFDFDSAGDESATVANNDPLTYSTDTIGPITSVVIEAAVQTNASALWSNITVNFLQNGSIVESDSFASGPQVNTVNAGASNTAAQTLTITPTVPNSDEVLITGQIRMASPGITNPSPNGMFCTVFVNGANASSSGGGGGISIGPGQGDS